MTALVILAAGLGSRFGGTKQLAVFGPEQRTLMEYNIVHAANAGFDKVVFVIRPELKEALSNEVIPRLPEGIHAQCAFQTPSKLPANCKVLDNRLTPLGTAHAVWCSKDYLDSDFAVINADDYYGPHAFELMTTHRAHHPDHHLMVGFELEKTLSAHGSVNRGVCSLSPQQLLLTIAECETITRQGDSISGRVSSGAQLSLAPDTLVSMNCWLFNADLFDALEQYITDTLNNIDAPNSECYLPNAVMQQITSQGKKVKVLTSKDQWLGLTYANDYDHVADKINELSQRGLFSIHQ